MVIEKEAAHIQIQKTHALMVGASVHLIPGAFDSKVPHLGNTEAKV